MKDLVKGFFKPALWALALCLLIIACSDDLGELADQDAQLTSAEVETILEANELSSLTDGLLTDIFSSDQTEKTAKSTDCQQIETSNTITTITFNDCTVDGSDLINGTITANYSIAEESTEISVTYTDFTIGTIKISGNKTFTFDHDDEQEGFVFTVESDMQVVMSDGKELSERGTKIIGFVFNSLEDQSLTLDGEWTITSDGNTYSAVVENLLKKKYTCAYTGEGLLLLSKNGLAVSVDFGDGACDDVALINYPDGTTEQITLKD
ncbi:hypothetical protein FGM00_07990 [Aggregatimonas sangjinii]|uniref:Lipoprotein n=1 Tax=Aggregatimonas sangjinii TaxID=2583587 RepID=A0A5B7STL4_9FLAO|nr:hypothetical protein [Aggregatimonas sangjinii]QCX00044.1 hypothetical protein FGM00_07990 [Aggregatimonas sangjinii]